MIKFLPQKKIVIMILIALIGFCLILFSSQFSSKDKNTKNENEYYSEFLEEKIENLLLEMQEIDSVSVLITLENSGETLYAQNHSTNLSEYVIYSADNGQSGLKIADINPKIRGVAVVCNNGDNISTQSKIISLLSSALGISTNKITVSN